MPPQGPGRWRGYCMCLLSLEPGLQSPGGDRFQGTGCCGRNVAQASREQHGGSLHSLGLKPRCCLKCARAKTSYSSLKTAGQTMCNTKKQRPQPRPLCLTHTSTRVSGGKSPNHHTPHGRTAVQRVKTAHLVVSLIETELFSC